jgi:hypothetical protein
MTEADFILQARAVVHEAEEKGFTHTAEAMRLVLHDMLNTAGGAAATQIILDRRKLQKKYCD